MPRIDDLHAADRSHESPTPGLDRVAVITALAAERKCLDACGGLVDVLQSGPGQAAAAQAARIAVRNGASALLSFGLAGALEPGLRAGTAVVPADVSSADGTRWGVSPDWRAAILDALPESMPVSLGRICSTAEVLGGSAAKSRAGIAHEAVACDMESAAIAEIAREAGVEFAVVRVIADEFRDQLPDDMLDWVDEAGNNRFAAVLSAVVRPRQWKPLLVIALRFRRASAMLRSIASELAAAGFSKGIVARAELR